MTKKIGKITLEELAKYCNCHECDKCVFNGKLCNEPNTGRPWNWLEILNEKVEIENDNV